MLGCKRKLLEFVWQPLLGYVGLDCVRKVAVYWGNRCRRRRVSGCPTGLVMLPLFLANRRRDYKRSLVNNGKIMIVFAVVSVRDTIRNRFLFIAVSVIGNWHCTR